MNSSSNPSAIRSRKQITDALLKLMGEHPYEEISVKQIVLETGLVRKTFYRNFSSKDDVLCAYVDSIIYDYISALKGATDPLSVIFDFCKKNRKLIKLLQKNGLMHLFLLRLNEVIPKVNATADMSGNPFAERMTGLDADYLIAFNIGAVWNVINMWAQRGMREPLDKVRATIEEYLETRTT